jgi:hypothetical protein
MFGDPKKNSHFKIYAVHKGIMNFFKILLSLISQVLLSLVESKNTLNIGKPSFLILQFHKDIHILLCPRESCIDFWELPGKCQNSTSP